MRIIALTFFVFYILSTLLFADTVYLKNGRSISGIITKEDDSGVQLQISAGTVSFSKDSIDRIERSDLGEALGIQNSWDQERKAAADRYEAHQKAEESRPKEVEFSKEGKGIAVTARINGREDARLMLDTGASVILLRLSMADKLGFNTTYLIPDTWVQVADGKKVKAKHVVLKSVKVQNSEATNVDACILLDERGQISYGDGLLGMSFLKKFNFKIDNKEKKLILEKLQ